MRTILLRKKLRKLWFNIALHRINEYYPMEVDNGTVVLVRLDAIGDFIMSYSAFCEYRSFYRNKRMILVCSVVCSQLAQAWNIADEIITIDLEKFCNERDYKKANENILSAMSAEIVIQMVTNRTAEMEYITSLIKSGNKIAMSRDNAGSIWRRKWDSVYSRILPYDDINTFEINKFFYLLNSIRNTETESYQAVLPKTKCRYIDKEPYFIIAQGGSFSGKKWDNEKFATVANYILRRCNIKCYLLGADGDRTDNELIYRGIIRQENVRDLTGKTTILESIEVVRGAEFVITNDTCFIHMAVAVNTKSICIAGGWHWGRFVPYGILHTIDIYNFPALAYDTMNCFKCNFRNRNCRRIMDGRGKVEKLPCISNITVENVLGLLDECLRERYADQSI